MAGPIFPNVCRVARCQTETVAPNTDPGGPLPLTSFPGQSLMLPVGSHVLTSRPNLSATLGRDQVLAECLAYLRQALNHLALPSAPRLLLVLPDKTRTNIAAHLLLDAVLSLQTEWPVLQFTVLFGLGTHPPMTDQDLEKWLEPQRYQQLKQRKVVLRQQTTRAPLQPRATVVLEDSPEMSATSFLALDQTIAQLQGQLTKIAQPDQRLTLEHYLALEDAFDATAPFQSPCPPPKNPSPHVRTSPVVGGQPYHLSLPLELWQHHLTIVAGDTELHPYEVRGGSGGIHKMLAVGLADLQTIRRTHSTRLLLEESPCPDGTDNAFVRSLDHIVSCLYQDLLHRPGSLACTIPLGLSIVSLQPGCINGLWLGQAEQSRQQLTQIIRKSNTVELSQATHLVVCDTDRKKGTDILAGARALQLLCEKDRADNLLLADSPRQRVALLFNPCLENLNHGGIGNRGTKKQLDVLGKLVQDCQTGLLAQLSAVQTVEQALALVRAHRRQVLRDWIHHLLLVSDFYDFLALLKTLIALLRQWQRLDGEPQKIREYLQSTLSNYANLYSDEGRVIQQLLDAYCTEGDLEQLWECMLQLQQADEMAEGLGEGGQRALRLLKILQKFETFILATNNATVLSYLEVLDPGLLPLLPPDLRQFFKNSGLRFSLLGITGIDLNQQSCQQALEKAMNYASFYNAKKYQITFMQRPLIIQRL